MTALVKIHTNSNPYICANPYYVLFNIMGL